MTRQPFDEESVFDRVAEDARKRFCEFAGDDFMSAKTLANAEPLIAGYLTGLIGVLFCMAEKKDRGAIEEYLAAYLPLAAEQAGSVMDGIDP